MKRPALLRHRGILTNWRDYPEGSVERAKALGLDVLFTFQRVETTLHLWEGKKDLVERERPWVTLGLPSRAAFIEAVTGQSEQAAETKFSKSDAIRQRRREYPHESQRQTARAVGCDHALVNKVVNHKLIHHTTNPLERLRHWWKKADGVAPGGVSPGNHLRH